MDAIAVTLASAGRYLGMAPLGTSLSDEQATAQQKISEWAAHIPAWLLPAVVAAGAGWIAWRRARSSEPSSPPTPPSHGSEPETLSRGVVEAGRSRTRAARRPDDDNLGLRGE